MFCQTYILSELDKTKKPMNSTRIWMKLMGYHNFYTGKDSNNSLIGKDNGERFADKRTHRHSTDIACQWVNCGYIPIRYTRNIPIFVSEKKINYIRLRLRMFFRSRTMVSDSTSEYICVVLTEVCPSTFCTVVMATP